MIRRLWPDSIVGRTVLVLLVGLLLSHTVALAIYSGNRVDTLINIGGRAAAERVAGIIQLVEEAPAAERRTLLRALDVPGLRVRWTTEPLIVEQSADPLALRVREVVRQRLGVDEVRVALGAPEQPPEGGGFGRGFGRPGDGHRPHLHRMWHGGPLGDVVRVAVRLSDGSWLNFMAPLDMIDSLWRPRFVLSLAVMAVLVMLIGVWALRRATRPFATFAAAAERLGVDVAAPPLPETGPREVRGAAHAFNVMQGRLRRFVEDRTQMLAAISHDLRTPITRMRLRAEFVDDDEQREKMLADLAEMEAMIAATLAFARDDAASEPHRPMDLGSLLQGLADDFAETGAAVAYHGPQSLAIRGRPAALKRAFANLVDNAVKYGGGAEIGLSTADGLAVVEIADRGPGIPEAEREKVFAPFYRLERSRSRETGGSGLGLAVARSILRGHGGDIALAARPGGGLTARAALPL